MPEAGARLTLALPAYFEFEAPKAWRKVDFISDLHLSAALPNTLRAFEQHLRQTPAEAVIILGDLFELWVGDDARARPFERHCVEILSEAASRVQLAFMVGNRDFLVGTSMLQDCGMMGLPDPTLLDAWGQRVLLTHGDALCLDDAEYQGFRRQVRGEAWQHQFLARPLEERLRIAAEIRERSQARRQFDSRPDADIDNATTVAWMHGLGAAEIVHGHTHRPGSQALAPGFQRHVLSDWDLDGDKPRAEVLRLTRDGFRRLAPAGTS